MKNKLLQQFWKEKFPNAGVDDIYNLSEDNFTLELLHEFANWVCVNYHPMIK